MADSLAYITADLYHFMLEVEVENFRRRTEERYALLRTQAQELAERFEHAVADKRSEMMHRLNGPMRQKAIETAANLKRLNAEFSARTVRRENLRESWKRLNKDYEDLVSGLKNIKIDRPKGFTFPTLKPRNISRNIFHLSSNVFAVCLYHFFFTRSQMIVIACSILAFMIGLDIARRVIPGLNDWLIEKSGLGKISRAKEFHSTPTAVYAVAGLALGVWAFPKMAIIVADLILGIADPAASLVGKHFGRFKLYGSKSLVGSLTFFLVAFLLSFSYLTFFAASSSGIIACSLAVALVGSLTELFSDTLDDNFTIPLICGGVMTLLLF
ncbi:MAG: SEC59/DGK1/VTE5 family protein [Myxococcota bacterium]|jgi:dolichol kinase|nr:SEC59/DGK1/VTE5 family protein [Myxococcota bacterium]